MTTLLDCGHAPSWKLDHAYDPMHDTITIEDQASWVCRCGTHYNEHGPAGIARDADDRTMCYGCADSRQAIEIETLPAITLYHVDDNVTTWSGGVLGRVIGRSSWVNALTGSRMTAIRVRTAGGRILTGRYGSDRSQAVTLRPVKASA